MYVVHGSNNRDTPGNVLYAVETHCLCELLNRYVIITKHAIVSALLFSQSEQKVKSGICTIEYKTYTKGLRKKSLCVFNLCENYTIKQPMAQAVFVKNTQQKRRFIYITFKARAQTPLALFWRFGTMYVYSIECERQRKGGRNDNRMNRTRSETREAGSIADGAQRGNTGQRIHLLSITNRSA